MQTIAKLTENQKQIAGVTMSNAIAQKLTNFDIFKLDEYEYTQFNEFKTNGKEFALQVLINNVEGDFTQLSKHLAKIAKQQ